LGVFQLGKVPLGKGEYSSGHKLPLGKLDPRLFAISINSGSGAVLHDIAYGLGKTQLFPARDSVNFELIDATVKDLQFFVRNPTSTLETDPTVLFEDDLTGWYNADWGTGSYRSTLASNSEQVVSGSSSAKFVVTADGAKAHCGWRKDFSSQDWASKDVACLYVYGANTGLTLRVSFFAPNISNGYKYETTDNWTGWRKINVFIGTLLTETGSPNKATVTGIRVAYTYVTQPFTNYLDRTVVDVCPSVAVKKASMEFYLDNVAEETASPLVLADDDQAALWNKSASFTLTDDTMTKQKGTNALKAVIASASQNDGIWHLYGSSQNWSAYDFICLYFYGANTGNNWRVGVSNDTNDNATIGTGWYYAVTDNFTGFRRIIIPLKAMTVNSGTPSLTTVRKIVIINNSNPPSDATVYLDRVVLDVGTWAKVEIAVPDVLCPYYNYLVGFYYDWDYWTLKVWDGSSYRTGTTTGVSTNSKWFFETYYTKFLDGSSLYSVYGETQTYLSLLSASMLIAGLKGQTKTRKRSDTMANQSITYSQVGTTKKRIGFSLKMAPSDMRQTSTYGISQCRLKLEVYCP
jgi:hypothetical protein